MKAEAEIILPAGVTVGEGIPILTEYADRESTVKATIKHVGRHAMGTQIRVILEIDAELIASFDAPTSDRGRTREAPAVRVKFKPKPEPKEIP